MSLDLNQLEKVREAGNGLTQARCPACAEGGHDRAGEHLRIYPDGRFGCCVYPKDKEHRRRIFALAGERTTRPMRVRVASGAPAVRKASSISESLKGFLGTLGTPKSESVTSVPNNPECLDLNLGTLGTGNTNPHAYEKKEVMCTHDVAHMCKDLETGVPSVPSGERLPYLDRSGGLVIPFNSPERYHYWKPDGQRMSVKETLAEVKQRLAGGKDNHGTEF